MNIDDLAQLIDDIGGRSVSGIAVNSHNALTQATVFACVRVISECVSSLPVRLMRHVSADEVEHITDHPALQVLESPNDYMTWHELCQYWVTHSELRGNAYAFKNRSGDGRVREFLPIQPDMVGCIQWYDWSIVYTVGSGKEGVNGKFGPDKIFHLRNFGTLGYKGESTIALQRDEIGLGLDMQRHAGSVFRNGANVGAAFQHPKTLSQTAYERLKASLAKEYGGVLNAGKPIILEEGMTIEKLGMNNDDAELIESRRYTKQEIASIFGVPMFLLNDTEKSTTWGTGLEQTSRAFLNFSLNPRLNRICETLKRELLLPKERADYFFAFDTSRFTLGDFESRFKGYSTAILAGIMSPNDARHAERLNARKGGDVYYTPPNVMSQVDGATGEVAALNGPLANQATAGAEAIP